MIKGNPHPLENHKNAAPDDSESFKAWRTRQIVDGLDEFCEDYRNARILVHYTVEYVVTEARGEDSSQLLQFMRKQAPQPQQR